MPKVKYYQKTHLLSVKCLLQLLRRYGGGSWAKITSCVHLIELFAPVSKVFAKHQNSKYFSRNRAERARKSAFFGPQNGLKKGQKII